MKVEKTHYGVWEHAYKITNGEVEMIVTSSNGPRVIHFGFTGGQNFFRVFPDGKGFNHKSHLGEWFIMGGHRLWAAPETVPATYFPDNGPVKIDVHEDGLTATAEAETSVGLQKSITIKMGESGTGVEMIHKITNIGGFPTEIAPWALSVMAQGGVGVTGFPPRGTHPEVLPPSNPLIMWAFTDLSDPRWIFTKKHLALKQDPRNNVPQKLGHFNQDTWAAYLLNGEAFLKKYKGEPGKPYADMGSSFEIFTNADFLELETLGPLQKLPPGETLTHIENWSLHKNVQVDQWNDETLDRVLGPLRK